MKAAGLKDIDTVITSTAILIKNKNSKKQEMIDLIASRIRGVISRSSISFMAFIRSSMFLSTFPTLVFRSPEHYYIVYLLISFPAAQKYVLCQYNIARSSLELAKTITPGKRAPTVTALDAQDWVAVSSMVEKKHVANKMDELTKIGATDILVLDIANSRTG